MQVYFLKCPYCKEDGMLYAKIEDPAFFFCKSCDEEFSLDDVREFVEEWVKYIADYDAMITRETTSACPHCGSVCQCDDYCGRCLKHIDDCTCFVKPGQ